MGIKSLVKSLKDEGYESLVLKLKDLKGLIISMDFSTFLYEQYSVARKRVYLYEADKEDDNYELDVEATEELCIKMVYKNITRFIDNGIIPVIIMEGEVPIEKDHEKEKRNKTSEKALSEYNRLVKEKASKEKVYTKLSACTKPSRNFMEKLGKILKSAGIPVIKAAFEAEELAADLCYKKIVDIVYSEDMDTLVYGPSYHMRKHDKGFEIFSLKDILKTLNLSYDQFIDYCILHGCDYGNKVNRYMPPQFIKDLKFYGSLDNMEKQMLSMDFSCLNITACMNRFCTKEWDGLIHKDNGLKIINDDVIKELIRPKLPTEEFDQYGLESPRWIDSMLDGSFYSNRQKPKFS